MGLKINFLKLFYKYFVPNGTVLISSNGLNPFKDEIFIKNINNRLIQVP